MGLRDARIEAIASGAVALVLCSCVLFALAPGALASSREVALTSRYVRANYALVHAAYSRIKPVEARLRELLAQIRRECPRVADGSPEEALSVQLRTEIIGALVVSAVHLDIGAGKTFLAAVRGLSWANRSLTRTVAQYASKVSRMIALPAPNICGDVESWVQSAYTTLPAFTGPFDTEFLALVGLARVAALWSAPVRVPESAPAAAQHRTARKTRSSKSKPARFRSSARSWTRSACTSPRGDRHGRPAASPRATHLALHQRRGPQRLVLAAEPPEADLEARLAGDPQHVEDRLGVHVPDVVGDPSGGRVAEAELARERVADGVGADRVGELDARGYWKALAGCALWELSGWPLAAVAAQSSPYIGAPITKRERSGSVLRNPTTPLTNGSVEIAPGGEPAQCVPQAITNTVSAAADRARSS